MSTFTSSVTILTIFTTTVILNTNITSYRAWLDANTGSGRLCLAQAIDVPVLLHGPGWVICLAKTDSKFH
jgi:hypothetical protein